MSTWRSSPFVHATYQSIHKLQWEITYVTKGIIDAAMKSTEVQTLGALLRARVGKRVRRTTNWRV